MPVIISKLLMYWSLYNVKKLSLRVAGTYNSFIVPIKKLSMSVILLAVTPNTRSVLHVLVCGDDCKYMWIFSSVNSDIFIYVSIIIIHKLCNT